MDQSRKRIFIFSGRQGSGKSTYAENLKKILGEEHCQVFKFAQVIYELHDASLPILKKYGIVSKDINKEGSLLQVLGTEFGRKCKGENVWVDVTRRLIDEYLAEHSRNYAIIDDCRFENEFDAFHPVATMIRLSASRDIRKARCPAWRENDLHASEVGLDDYETDGNFDFVVLSDGSVPPHRHLEIILQDTGHLRYD